MNSTLDAHDSGNAGNTADGICDDGAGHCTLRAAIDEANLAPLGSTIGITVPAGTYALDAGLGTIFISGGANITITGAGSSTTTVDGVNLSTVQLFMTDVAVTVSMSGLTITRGSGIDGGAIQNSGTLTLTNSIVSNSTAGNVGGGIYNDGTLTLTGATVSGNQANASGLADVNFFCDAGGGICNDGGTVTLNSGTRITSNVAASNGGGVDNKGTLTGAGTLFSGNTANTSNSSGGAIDTQTATVSVSDSMFVNNAAHTAGAMSLFGSGTLTVSGSTFSGNSAGNGGGGIAINGGTATITNSTFSGNTTPGLANGGAVSNAGGAMTLNGVTISGNDNGITNFSGTISVQNSIISNSSVGSNCSGTITDGGYNIDLGPSCGFMATSSTSHSMSNTNPMLGALASNGGPTQTMALQSGSPAIDAIPVSAGICSNSAPSTDQRGVARPQGSGCDIGAYELQPTPTASPTVTVTATATVTAAATPTATPTASAPTPTPTAAPAPSGGGGTTSSSSTTSSTSPSTSTSSGDAQVVGSQSAGTGVLNVAAPNTPLTTGILAPDAAPLVDPGLITGTAPAPITAQVSTTTTNTVAVVAGNFVLVVPPGSIQAPSGSAVIDIKPATNVPIPGGPAQFSPFGSVADIKIADKGTGQPITIFPVAIPIQIQYNAADVAQAKGDPTTLTLSYVVDDYARAG